MLRATALDLKPQSLKNLQQSDDLYRQVLVLEPKNTNAMVGLARSLVLQASNFGYQTDESVQEKKWVEARDLALRAKELDPDNPRIYSVIGAYASNHGNQEGAMRAYETRLSLEPKSPGAYNNLAIYAFYGAEPRRAIELLTKAINLDPKHPHGLLLMSMGPAYFMLGDNDAAIEWCLKSLETNPTFPYTRAYLAMAYALKGGDAKARAETTELRRLGPNIKLSAFETPDSSHPAAYKEWFESKLVPAWRKAGLPE